jgi:DNA-binding GntR family transcriptional regulator
MQEAIDELPNGPVPRSTFRAADGKFHAALAHAARNVRLEDALRKARSEMFLPTDKLQFEEEVESTRREHQKIIDGVTAQDETSVAELVEQHINETRQAILRIVGMEGRS